jgi:hypothetical protein
MQFDAYSNASKYAVSGDYVTLSAFTASYDFGSTKLLKKFCRSFLINFM